MQNMSLRGHRDDGRIDSSGDYPDENDGNFKMLLRFRVRGGDDNLKHHLQHCPSNALYTSKNIQNEILCDISSMLKREIAKKSFEVSFLGYNGR